MNEDEQIEQMYSTISMWDASPIEINSAYYHDNWPVSMPDSVGVDINKWRLILNIRAMTLFREYFNGSHIVPDTDNLRFTEYRAWLLDGRVTDEEKSQTNYHMGCMYHIFSSMRVSR